MRPKTVIMTSMIVTLTGITAYLTTYNTPREADIKETPTERTVGEMSFYKEKQIVESATLWDHSTRSIYLDRGTSGVYNYEHSIVHFNTPQGMKTYASTDEITSARNKNYSFSVWELKKGQKIDDKMFFESFLKPQGVEGYIINNRNLPDNIEGIISSDDLKLVKK